jgi:hypothetical protein
VVRAPPSPPRQGEEHEAAGDPGEDHGADAEEVLLDPVLERQADDAEARGDYSAAVRLRFRAGLLRLDHAGAIRLGPSLTAGQVARRLSLDAFDAVAREFETVAYGGHDADHDAVTAARRGWSRVLATVGER